MILDRWKAAGREVAVIGLARSGIAATRLLRREGIAVYASDQANSPAAETDLSTLRGAGADVQLGAHDLARITRAAAVVVSPGVPPHVPPLEAARLAGVEIVSEVDVGWAALPGVRFAVITGTNGKTTTTALTAHLLEAAGLKAVAAGNIGRPLSAVALDEERPEWIALEISSFQLHDVNSLVPDVGVLTNLSPDHLDRYPTLEEYYADKARLYLHAGPHSYWVSNADDSAAEAMAQSAAGTHAHFSTRHRADAWYDQPGRRLMLADQALISRDQLALLGDHNVANALAASLAAHRAGGSRTDLAEGLRTFRALPHRLEPVREVGGVLWINDSKATNIASTEVAVSALDRPYVLLLGGRHKGEPYTRLGDRLAAHCRAVIAFGEAQEIILRDLGGRVPIAVGHSFEDVISQARRLAKPGDAVLLSPACASYDMFRNFEDRGAQFRAVVEAM